MDSPIKAIPPPPAPAMTATLFDWFEHTIRIEYKKCYVLTAFASARLRTDRPRGGRAKRIRNRAGAGGTVTFNRPSLSSRLFRARVHACPPSQCPPGICGTGPTCNYVKSGRNGILERITYHSCTILLYTFEMQQVSFQCTNRRQPDFRRWLGNRRF